MTPTNESLGVRWIAKGGGLLPGMSAMLVGVPGDYRARVHRIEGAAFYTTDTTSLPYALAAYVPDFSDAATRGIALAVVRERWSIKRLWVEFEVDNAMWSVGDWVLGWACLDGENPPPDIMGDDVGRCAEVPGDAVWRSPRPVPRPFDLLAKEFGVTATFAWQEATFQYDGRTVVCQRSEGWECAGSTNVYPTARSALLAWRGW